MLRVEDGGPRLTLTTWKISAGGNVADNYWREGNLLAKLDQKTGRILHCTTRLAPRHRTVEHHPRTGPPLAGLQAPFPPRANRTTSGRERAGNDQELQEV